MSGEVYINFEEGSKRVLNNTNLYIKMMGLFKDDKNINNLEAAIEDGDFVKAQSAAHTIKGLAGNLSLSKLFNRLMEMDLQLKTRLPNADTMAAVSEKEIKEKMLIVKNTYNETLVEIDKVIEKYASINK